MTTALGAATSTSKDMSHKSSSLFGGVVPGQRVLGDVSNVVEAAISATANQDAKEPKPLVKSTKF
ncbi:hypothetical protein PCANC_00212 [Puccinia coronata f. sp. avenae]|uniref:Uncharacterized protein n=1 Tax=Puccinia coronata f. sp. avenae TaxID=200324 RepID=A0A2N5W996_9BASI|nr:hypothetical protein PCANC_28008 [Puccinia coronata f. sp. avenae]PLW35267.1 hypothetical protein PCASD_13682 [Puccinia coronata f. sp. avenae]PLW58812.1 hypothetical protein PCANC_00212 [Puccinia coronata f. sp. avenae]